MADSLRQTVSSWLTWATSGTQSVIQKTQEGPQVLNNLPEADIKLKRAEDFRLLVEGTLLANEYPKRLQLQLASQLSFLQDDYPHLELVDSILPFDSSIEGLSSLIKLELKIKSKQVKVKLPCTIMLSKSIYKPPRVFLFNLRRYDWSVNQRYTLPGIYAKRTAGVQVLLPHKVEEKWDWTLPQCEPLSNPSLLQKIIKWVKEQAANNFPFLERNAESKAKYLELLERFASMGPELKSFFNEAQFGLARSIQNESLHKSQQRSPTLISSVQQLSITKSAIVSEIVSLRQVCENLQQAIKANQNQQQPRRLVDCLGLHSQRGAQLLELLAEQSANKDLISELEDIALQSCALSKQNLLNILPYYEHRFELVAKLSDFEEFDSQ